eukprot:gene11110-13594_t
MAMYFHWSYLNQPIVFEKWSNSSPGLYALSIIIVFSLAILSEYTSSYRHFLNSTPLLKEETEQTGLINGGDTYRKFSIKKFYKQFLTTHAWKTMVHVFQYALNYLIMLIFMTYNAGLAIAILCGVAVGYFLFGKRRVVIEEELCH